MIVSRRTNNLILPIICSSINLHMRSTSFPANALMNTTQVTAMFPRHLTQRISPSHLDLLATTCFAISALRPLLKGIRRAVIKHNGYIHTAPIWTSRNAHTLATCQRQIISRRRHTSYPIRPSTHVITSKLTSTSTSISTMPTQLTIRAVFTKILTNCRSLAIVPIRPPMIHIQPLVIPTSRVRIIVAKFRPKRRTQVPVLFLRHSTTLIHTPPIHILCPIQKLRGRHKRNHGP